MDDVEQRYDNHFDEWREEENKNRYERKLAKKNRYVHPHDPNFISPEEPGDAE